MRASATPGRLHVADLERDVLDLSAEESHYVTRVCRAQAGDRLEATDGQGLVGELVIESPGTPARVRVQSRTRVPLTGEAWVICGAPEGERGDWLVEKLAELGVRRFVPVDTDRARWGAGSARLERWGRLAVAALRQSQRAWRLEVEEPRPLEAALGQVPGDSVRRLASEAGSQPESSPRARLEVMVIGPAQGFEVGELRRLESSGYLPIRLSDARLRTETAALAWASWWSARGPA